MEILVDSASACAGQAAECGFFAKGNGSAQIGRGRRPRRPATIPLYLCLPQWGRGGRDAMRLAEFSRWENIPPDEVSRLRRSGSGVRLFCKGNGSDPYRLVQKTHKPVGATIGRPFSHPVRRATNGRPYGIVGAAQTPSCAGCLPLPTYTKEPPLGVRAGVSLRAVLF